MYAQSALIDDEVVLLAIGRIKVNVNRNLKLLVVCLIDQIYITHDAHHALALGSKFVHIDISTLIIHHLIVLEQHHHFIRCRTVNHIVGKFLIIAKRTVIDTDVSQFNVCAVASYLYVDR